MGQSLQGRPSGKSDHVGYAPINGHRQLGAARPQLRRQVPSIAIMCAG